MLTPQQKTDLATTIENRDPYAFMAPLPQNQGITLAPDWQSQVEEGGYTDTFWSFKGEDFQVIRAAKIPYTYQDAHGNMIKEYLLIGYTGSAGV